MRRISTIFQGNASLWKFTLSSTLKTPCILLVRLCDAELADDGMKNPVDAVERIVGPVRILKYNLYVSPQMTRILFSIRRKTLSEYANLAVLRSIEAQNRS